VEKVKPYHIRDLQFTFAPDGYAYLTGSGCDPAFVDKIMLYRSKDLRNWEIVDTQFDYLNQVPGATQEDYELRFGEKQGVDWKATTWTARSITSAIPSTFSRVCTA
jgi:hypothetical protein